MRMLLAVAQALAAEPVSGPAALPIVPDARFALALYCNPTCSDDLLDELDAALAPIRSADEFSEHVAEPQRIMGIAGEEFGIPDAEFVTEFGDGVQDVEALARSRQVVLAWFAGPRERSIETFTTAHAAFAKAAKSTNGWVEDLDTQMLFGAEAWALRDPRAPIASWFVVDSAAADDGARLRLVTRGLRRYGDFDLVVEGVTPEATTDVGWALDAIAETLHPLGDVAPELTVHTDTARGVARFEVAVPRDDDPSDALLRVRFSGEITVDDGPVVAAEAPFGGGEPPVPEGAPPPAAPVPATASAPVPVAPAASAPGAPAAAPPAPPAPGPRTLAEAEAQVREALVTYEAAWAKGLPAGDHFAVSAPFTTGTGGREYLWIEVTRWGRDDLSGTLVTAPAGVVGLRVGDEVVINRGDVFDFVYKHADGRKEGNLTRPFR